MLESLTSFFPHWPLLGGLLLIGVPVVIHLIMRQRPKHHLFPAFRLLVQKHRTNQRKLQLRHLALLLLRILLILLLCLALADAMIPPDLFGDRFVITSGQPVAVALVIDTSPSMEYVRGGKSRLADAQQRALELLEDLPEESRVAVFDSAEAVSGRWAESLPVARKMVTDLQIRYANRPVTDVLDHAYNLLGSADARAGGKPLPRFLYVFSDRTIASWDERRAGAIQSTRDHLKGPKVQAVYVDVGEKQPKNLAVTSLKLPRQTLAANETLTLDATVQATGRDYDSALLCRFDDERDTERKPFQLTTGRSQSFHFERAGLKPGIHRAEIFLESPDNLPFSANRFATVEIRPPRQVLVISDFTGDDKNAGDADEWLLALNTQGAYKAEAMTTKAAEKLTANDLAKYQAVCLLDVARPKAEMWEQLRKYVAKGGGLAILPGGRELDPRDYNDEPARALMPAKLDSIIETREGAKWDVGNVQHPLMAPLRDWFLQGSSVAKVPGRAFGFWSVKDYSKDAVIVRYAGKEEYPALLERRPDEKVRGRVLLFTTPMDDRKLTKIRGWNDYLETPFFLALANKSVGYLTGDTDAKLLNFQTGQMVPVALPTQPGLVSFTLTDLRTGVAVVLPRPEGESLLRITPERVSTPASYRVAAGREWETGFSLNVPDDECQLERVPKEQIEQVLGSGAVVEIDSADNLRKRLEGQWGQPIPLFPWLMILLLLALAVENLLANRFYRRDPAGETKSV